MIAFCRSYLVKLLGELGVATVFTWPEDAEAFSGTAYGAVFCAAEKLERLGKLAAREDRHDQSRRVFRRQIYSCTPAFRVRLVGPTLEAAEPIRLAFLCGLPDRIGDADGNAIGIEVTEGSVIQSKSGGTPKEGYEFLVNFQGGIYRDENIRIFHLESELEYETEVERRQD